jgi:hypothetical protein
MSETVHPEPVWLQGPDAPRRMLEALEVFGAGVAVKELGSGAYVQASPALDRLFERSESTLVGSHDGELMRPDEVHAMRRVELQAMQQRGAVLSEHRLDVGGRRREFSVARVPLDERHLLCAWLERTQEKQREVHLQRALAQIEQLQQEVEALRRDAQRGSGRDELTGLQHLGPFNEQLQREADLSTREHREFALVLIELDPLPPTPCRPWDVPARSACSRRWAVCCAGARGRWTRPAATTATGLPCCCRAWDWPRRTRAWRPAPPVRDADRAARWQ